MRSFLVTCSVLGAASVVLAGSASGCSSTSCSDTNSCIGAGDDGSVDGMTGDVTVGDGSSEGSPGDDASGDGSDGGSSDALLDTSDGFDGFFCNPTWTPSDNNCVVDDMFGVFVSPNGADGAAGTKAMPLKKIQDGIAKAKTAGKRLYVCAATYAENAVIDTSNDGVAIYGGLSCTTWTYGVANKVIVAPATGYALKLDTLTTGAHVEDVEFDSADATTAGGSSVAILANASQSVVLRRVTSKAGNAQPGAAGAAVANYSGATAASGGNASGTAGGVGGGCACLDALTSSRGGNGAAPGGIPMDGSAVPPVGASNGGSSGAVTCTDGTFGANGASAASGAGSMSSGSLSTIGWTVGPAGSDGSVGRPAQGGGGGGSKNVFGGGGGGCGGCGGGRGTGGGSGGSSLGLATVNSGVTLDSCTITAGNGGSGGQGANGQAGQGGGALGAGACNGGSGGLGGAGGGGGGGAGGLSIAIAYKGTAPTEMGTVNKTFGTAGSAGAAGGGATPGRSGVAQATMSF